MQRVLFTLTALAIAAVASAQNRGEAIYLEKCASCHGVNLQGGNAQSMVDGFWQFGGGDGELHRNIKFGISAVGMPAYNATLSDDDIRSVIGFIRDAAKREGAQRPPLPEQLATRDYDVKVTKWIEGGLDTPWGLTFVDDNTALITERPGRLRIVRDGKLDPKPISGTPEVVTFGQGGLLDVAVDPDYSENGWVYLSYAHGTGERDQHNNPAAMTRIVRGKIKDGAWTDEEVLFEAPKETYRNTAVHFGSRFAFDKQGRLYFSIGERGHQDDAQDPKLPNGKVHRVNRDGSIPADNPFADGKEGMPSVFTYGNRNAQGLATHPRSGAIWETEHGPMGGDEVNILKSGANYGWPKITYGINYNGLAISDKQRAEGIEQPAYYWIPSIAVCGIEFCKGGEFPRWQNNLIVSGLAYETVQRLAIANGRVMHNEQLLKGAGRVRDIAVDPSGAIYAVINGPDMVVKLTNDGAALRQ